MISFKNIDGNTIKVTGKVITFSNFISFTRFLVAFPIVYLHFQNGKDYNLIIVLLVLYGAVSDYLDGLVARKTNTVSEVGKVIDPVSDKLCAAILFIYTVWIGWVPLWFLIANVIRDLLILLGSSFIKLQYGKVAMSIMSGKIAVNILALYWISVFFFRDEIVVNNFLIEATTVHSFLLIASTIAMVISLIDYFNRYRQIMIGAKFN